MRSIMGRARVAAAVTALLPVLAAPAARASSMWVAPAVHDCAFAADDTVRIDVMVSNTAAPVDTGSFQVSFDAAVLTFVTAERGALIAGWTDFSATDLGGGVVEIALADAGALPAPVWGHLARLVFVTGCCGSGTPHQEPVCIPARAGDFLALSPVCGTFECVPANPGSITISTVYQPCEGGVDTVRVAVRLEDTPGPVDAGGLDVAFDPFRLDYVGYERGDLTAGWQLFDAADLTTVIRVGGFDLTALPPGTTGTFVTLKFLVNCCDGLAPLIPLCPQAAVDDLVPFVKSCGEVVCVAVSTRPVTWGHVKSLYR